MCYVYQINERTFKYIIKRKIRIQGGIINNYMRTMQVSIFSAEFPLFQSQGDKKNRGATMYVSHEKHSQFLVMETEPWKPEKGRKEGMERK